MINDYVTGHIRTYVPLIVGTALTLAAAHFGIVVDDQSKGAAIAAATGIVSAVYYTLVRALAEKWPWFGNLLGVNQAPTYSDH